jgi:hypothetical protein
MARKAEEHHTCFIVKDHTGLNLAYVYFEPEPNCRSAAISGRGSPHRSQIGQAPAVVRRIIRTSWSGCGALASARRKDVKYQGQSFIQQTTLAARSENLVGLFAERT